MFTIRAILDRRLRSPPRPRARSAQIHQTHPGSPAALLPTRRSTPGTAAPPRHLPRSVSGKVPLLSRMRRSPPAQPAGARRGARSASGQPDTRRSGSSIDPRQRCQRVELPPPRARNPCRRIPDRRIPPRQDLSPAIRSPDPTPAGPVAGTRDPGSLPGNAAYPHFGDRRSRGQIGRPSIRAFRHGRQLCPTSIRLPSGGWQVCQGSIRRPGDRRQRSRTPENLPAGGGQLCGPSIDLGK